MTDFSITKISSEEELQAAVDASNDLLVVLDVHKLWCGPCNAMVPTFQTVRAKTPAADKRMVIYSVEIEQFSEGIIKLLKDEASHVTVDGRGCVPCFIVLRKGATVHVVEGVNSPALELEMLKHMPPKHEGQGEEAAV